MFRRGASAARIGAPVAIDYGKVPNPNVAYGQLDIDPFPHSWRLIGSVAGVQLLNGQQMTSMGRRVTPHGTGYLDYIMPTNPGQTRRQGGPLPGNYMPVGAAPQQVAYVMPSAPSSAPTPYGPGQTGGTGTIQIINPGSGA